MSLRPALLAASLILLATPFAHSSDGLTDYDVWASICAWRGDAATADTAEAVAARPTVDCAAPPST